MENGLGPQFDMGKARGERGDYGELTKGLSWTEREGRWHGAWFGGRELLQRFGNVTWATKNEIEAQRVLGSFVT
jgi:hypothetical protein